MSKLLCKTLRGQLAESVLQNSLERCSHEMLGEWKIKNLSHTIRPIISGIFAKPEDSD
jgi:hypothetical protein